MQGSSVCQHCRGQNALNPPYSEHCLFSGSENAKKKKKCAKVHNCVCTSVAFCTRFFFNICTLASVFLAQVFLHICISPFLLLPSFFFTPSGSSLLLLLPHYLQKSSQQPGCSPSSLAHSQLPALSRFGGSRRTGGGFRSSKEHASEERARTSPFSPSPKARHGV